MRWKKIAHIKNESSISSSSNKISSLNAVIKKNRKLSQQIDISMIKK
jgi:hypothetical protein